jgi:hypothetical protein
MADVLQKLFGSPARVKLLRLFLFNPKKSFSAADAAAHARVATAETKTELAHFARMGIIEKVGRAHDARCALNNDFTHLAALQALLLNAPARGEDIFASVRDTGIIKLIILCGIFVGEWEGRLDLLLVGERMNEKKLRARIRSLEAELGKELRFALLTPADFSYRLTMHDRLLRDVLDYPHRIVLDKLESGLK